MSVAFYMDEHVELAITRGARRRGVDVLRVQDDGHGQTDDEIILDRAAVLGRVMFTRDADFLILAQARQAAGIPFAGVVYAHPDSTTIGQCIADLELIAGAGDAIDLANRVEYLPL